MLFWVTDELSFYKPPHFEIYCNYNIRYRYRELFSNFSFSVFNTCPILRENSHRPSVIYDFPQET